MSRLASSLKRVHRIVSIRSSVLKAAYLPRMLEIAMEQIEEALLVQRESGLSPEGTSRLHDQELLGRVKEGKM